MSLVRKLQQWVSGEGGAADPGTSRAVARRILIVCTGNICRSPIAEGVLRAKLRAAGLSQLVMVDSAGTLGYHTGEPPDVRAIRQAARRGYDIAGLRARPVTPEDFQRFDRMLALDNSHLDWLRKHPASSRSLRIERLMDHARRHAGISEVPDPYYGPEAGFERVLDLVEDACDGVVTSLKANAARRA